MRLWHYELISKLPRQQLLGQHRECCALRGLGFYKKHSTIDYIKKYGINKLYQYHLLVITEMKKRGYNVDPKWLNPFYRGKKLNIDMVNQIQSKNGIYPEHNDKYLVECLQNLKNKGITIEI